MWVCEGCRKYCNFGPNAKDELGEDMYLCDACMFEANTEKRKLEQIDKDALVRWLS